MPAKNAQLSELNGTYSEGHCGGIFQIAVGKKNTMNWIGKQKFFAKSFVWVLILGLYTTFHGGIQGSQRQWNIRGQQIGPPCESVIPCQVRTIFFQSSPQPSSIGSLKALLSMQRAIQGRPALYLLQWNVAVPGHCQVQLMTTLRFFSKHTSCFENARVHVPWAPLCPTPWWCPL